VIHPLIAELTEERHRQGLSLAEAAAAAGLTRMTIWRWENGVHVPGLLEASMYAAALGYTLTLAPTREVTRGTA